MVNQLTFWVGFFIGAGGGAALTFYLEHDYLSTMIETRTAQAVASVKAEHVVIQNRITDDLIKAKAAVDASRQALADKIAGK